VTVNGKVDEGIRLIGWRRKLIEAIERQRAKDPHRPRTFVVHFPAGFGPGASCQVFDTTPAGRVEIDDLAQTP
jgi:hypothetical protein